MTIAAPSSANRAEKARDFLQASIYVFGTLGNIGGFIMRRTPLYVFWIYAIMAISSSTLMISVQSVQSVIGIFGVVASGAAIVATVEAYLQYAFFPNRFSSSAMAQNSASGSSANSDRPKRD